jgi:hypothetical protein
MLLPPTQSPAHAQRCPNCFNEVSPPTHQLNLPCRTSYGCVVRGTRVTQSSTNLPHPPTSLTLQPPSPSNLPHPALHSHRHTSLLFLTITPCSLVFYHTAPLVRDFLFLVVALFSVLCSGIDGNISLGESALLLLVFALYEVLLCTLQPEAFKPFTPAHIERNTPQPSLISFICHKSLNHPPVF